MQKSHFTKDKGAEGQPVNRDGYNLIIIIKILLLLGIMTKPHCQFKLLGQIQSILGDGYGGGKLILLTM